MFRNWVTFYRKISLFFNATIATSFLPFCWFILEMEAGDQVGLLIDESKWTVRFAFFTLIFFVLYFSVKITRKGLKAINPEIDVSSKLYSFYRIYIKKFIFMELAAIIDLFAIYVLNDYFFIGVYIGILVWFSLIRPTYDYVVDKLRLTVSERKQLKLGTDF